MGIVLVVTLFLIKRYKRNLIAQSILKTTNQQCRLYPFEQKNILTMQAVSTLTLYSGVPPYDYLNKRIEEILVANPWLTGRLVTTNNQIVLAYNDTLSKNTISKHLTHLMPFQATITHSSIFLSGQVYQTVHRECNLKELQYNDLYNHFESYLVTDGKTCLNQNNDKGTLFKITVVVINESQFVVLVSLR